MSVGRGAALVVTANLVGQLIQLATLPVIARYAPPTVFAIYTLFVGFCAVTSVFAGLRYDAAIVVADADYRSRQVTRLVLALGVVTAAAAFFLALFSLILIWRLPLERSLGMAACAALYLLSNTGLRIALAWLTRSNRFAWVGGLQAAAVVATVATQLVGLRSDLDPELALAMGFAVGQAAAAAIALLISGKNGRWFARTSAARMRATARRYSAFPRYMIAYSLNSTLRERCIHVLLGWGAGAEALGKFAMVQRLAGAPHAFLHGGIGPPLLSYSRTMTRSEVAHTAACMIEMAAVALIPFFVFVIFNATALARLVFGDSWAGIAAYAQLLALPYLVFACTAFIDRLFERYGTQRAALRLDLAFSTVLFLALASTGVTGSGLWMTFAFACVYVVYELLWTVRTFATNALPMRRLKRTASISATQLAAHVVLNAVLLLVEPLVFRIAIASLVTAVSLLIHYHWAGGRAMLNGVWSQSARI